MVIWDSLFVMMKVSRKTFIRTPWLPQFGVWCSISQLQEFHLAPSQVACVWLDVTWRGYRHRALLWLMNNLRHMILKYKDPMNAWNMELDHPQFGKWSKVSIWLDCWRIVTHHFTGYGDCAYENTVSSRHTDASLDVCSAFSKLFESYESDWDSPRMMFMLSWIDLCESSYCRIRNVFCSLKCKHSMSVRWSLQSTPSNMLLVVDVWHLYLLVFYNMFIDLWMLSSKV